MILIGLYTKRRYDPITNPRPSRLSRLQQRPHFNRKTQTTQRLAHLPLPTSRTSTKPIKQPLNHGPQHP